LRPLQIPSPRRRRRLRTLSHWVGDLLQTAANPASASSPPPENITADSFFVLNMYNWSYSFNFLAGPDSSPSLPCGAQINLRICEYSKSGVLSGASLLTRPLRRAEASRALSWRRSGRCVAAEAGSMGCQAPLYAPVATVQQVSMQCAYERAVKEPKDVSFVGIHDTVQLAPLHDSPLPTTAGDPASSRDKTVLLFWQEASRAVLPPRDHSLPRLKATRSGRTARSTGPRTTSKSPPDASVSFAPHVASSNAPASISAVRTDMSCSKALRGPVERAGWTGSLQAMQPLYIT